MEIVMIEKKTYERMQHQLHELTEKVGMLSSKVLNEKSIE